MANSIKIIFFAGLVVLQLAVLPVVSPAGSVPDLFLILLVWFIFYRSVQLTLALALVGGLFFDLYSGTFFGAHLTSLFLLAGLLHILTTVVVPKEGNILLIASTFMLAMCFNSLCIYLFQLGIGSLGLGEALPSTRFLGKNFVIAMGLNLVLLYPVWYLTKRIIPR